MPHLAQHILEDQIGDAFDSRHVVTQSPEDLSEQAALRRRVGALESELARARRARDEDLQEILLAHDLRRRLAREAEEWQWLAREAEERVRELHAELRAVYRYTESPWYNRLTPYERPKLT